MQRSERAGVYAQHTAVLYENFSAFQNHSGAQGEARSPASRQDWLAKGQGDAPALLLIPELPWLMLHGAFLHFMKSSRVLVLAERQFERESNTELIEFCKVVNIALLD